MSIRAFGSDISNATTEQLLSRVPHGKNRGPLIVSVEAAIGAGKSTLLRKLQETKPDWVFVQEPVDMWQAVGGDPKSNLLEAYYGDMERYAFSFQTHCLLTRMQTVKEALEKSPNAPVIVLERSWFSDRYTFAEMQRETDKISQLEWALYDHWYNWLLTNAPEIHGHLYMHCSTETCMSRLRKRSRKEEVGVTDKYQQDLIEKHDKWLDSLESERVCTINVDKDFLDCHTSFDTVLDNVDNFIDRLSAKVE